MSVEPRKNPSRTEDVMPDEQTARARIDALWIYGRPLDPAMQSSPAFQVYEFMANDLGSDDPPMSLTDAFFTAIAEAGYVLTTIDEVRRIEIEYGESIALVSPDGSKAERSET